MRTPGDLALAPALGATMHLPSRGNAPRLSITRNDKIARPPRAVPEELNQRLEDGAQGKALVVWLNRLPEGRAVEVEVESGWLSLRSTPGGGIERRNPDPRPKLSVPQFPLRACFANSTTDSQPPTTDSQLNRVNPTESDRIAPQKSPKARMATASGRRRGGSRTAPGGHSGRMADL